VNKVSGKRHSSATIFWGEGTRLFVEGATNKFGDSYPQATCLSFYIVETCLRLFVAACDNIHCVSKKGTPTLSIVTLKGLTDFNDFWHKYSGHNWPSNGDSPSHLTQHLLLRCLGKPNKRNMHWNEQQTWTNWRLDRIKIWSRWSELVKYIVYLLSYYSTSG